MPGDYWTIDDTAQHYAQLLPAGYRADRRWPVLFVLDPRGRALHALRLFAEALTAQTVKDAVANVSEAAAEARRLISG